MIFNKTKQWGTFMIFVSPAIILYVIFAIIPLFMGFWLSTTNWDGVSPWVPVQIPIERFENEIIPNLSSANSEFIKQFYIKDESQGTYRKQETNELSLRGIQKYRAMAAFASADYINPNFKNVGLSNYSSILSSDTDPDFWPQEVQVNRFRSGEPLSKIYVIPAKEFEENFIFRLEDKDEKSFISSLYHKQGDEYFLDKARFPRKGQKFSIAAELIEFPDIGDDWEPFLDAVEYAGLDGYDLDIPAIAGETITSFSDGTISSDSLTALENGALELYEASTLKRVFSKNWFTNSKRLGVLLFTIFFSFANVLIVNVVALLIALALDQKIKAKNLLRSVFFIPNVLSMIVVAFIWQLVFSHIFPLVTGIDRWLSNPEIAPILTVIVASWQGMGYYMIIYLAGLQNVPQEMLESASIDGATGFRKFKSIILPMLVPAITIALFLSISGSLKTFDIIFALYPSTTNTMGVENLTINIYRNAFVDRQAGLANAKAIMLLLAIAVITGLQLRATKKKEVEL